MTNIKNAKIVKAIRTDHKLTIVDLIFDGNKYGRGLWRLNCSFLKEKDYVDEVKNIIINGKEKYLRRPGADILLGWDTIKMEIRSFSIKYASEKKKKIGGQ
jgi:hypothetical protein